MLRSEEVPSRTSTSRANGSLFDGSYLSLAATPAQQPQVHRSGGGGRAIHTHSNHVSLSCVSEFSPTDGPIKQHRIQKRECREPHSQSHHRCEHYQGSGQDSDSCLENGHHDNFNQHECKRSVCLHDYISFLYFFYQIVHSIKTKNKKNVRILSQLNVYLHTDSTVGVPLAQRPRKLWPGLCWATRTGRKRGTTCCCRRCSWRWRERGCRHGWLSRRRGSIDRISSYVSRVSITAGRIQKPKRNKPYLVTLLAS